MHRFSERLFNDFEFDLASTEIKRLDVMEVCVNHFKPNRYVAANSLAIQFLLWYHEREPAWKLLTAD
jgi:hypothetical protein